MRLKTSTRNPLAIAALTAALAFAAAPAAAADDTVALKNALYGAGYEVGNVNSTMDEATRSALRSFQQDQGLEATGELNEATKAALHQSASGHSDIGSAFPLSLEIAEKVRAPPQPHLLVLAPAGSPGTAPPPRL